MISTAEAKRIIRSNVSALAPQLMPLSSAWNKVLARDIFAEFDIPAFPQSSMDGYAIAYKDWRNKHDIKIIGKHAAAGDNVKFPLADHTAVRIFTGAVVPSGADTVVIQEKVRVEDDRLIIDDEQLSAGSNIREPGSEIKKGELALKKGTLLGAAAIGFLAGIGVGNLWVYPEPRVSVIVTGNELIEPGQAPEHGKVFESNSYALTAALKQFGHENVTSKHIIDDEKLLIDVIKSEIQSCDVLLLSGGVSVGDYDYVTKALLSCGVSTLFHKVRQRPGKPLLFGKINNTAVFGLPGNPSSVLTCFYEYVVLALENLCARSHKLPVLRVPIESDFQKKVPLAQFLKGSYDGNSVKVLASQESYKLNSFAMANCLIVLDEDTTSVKKGELVEIHLIN